MSEKIEIILVDDSPKPIPHDGKLPPSVQPTATATIPSSSANPNPDSTTPVLVEIAETTSRKRSWSEDLFNKFTSVFGSSTRKALSKTSVGRSALKGASRINSSGLIDPIKRLIDHLTSSRSETQSAREKPESVSSQSTKREQSISNKRFWERERKTVKSATSSKSYATKTTPIATASQGATANRKDSVRGDIEYLVRSVDRVLSRVGLGFDNVFGSIRSKLSALFGRTDSATTSRIAKSVSSGGKQVSGWRYGRAAVVAKTSNAAGVVTGRTVTATGAAAAAAATGTASGGASVGGAAAAGAAATASTAWFPPLAIAIAAVTAMFVGLAVGARKLTDWFDRQADELEEFSGAIAGARAKIESTQITNTVERARAIGPAVAQVEAAKGRFQDATTDLMTEISKELAKLAPILEGMLDMATATARGVETTVNLMQLSMAVASGDIVSIATEMVEVINSVNKMTEAFGDIFQTNAPNQQVNWVLGQNPFGQQRPQNGNPLPPGGRIGP